MVVYKLYFRPITYFTNKAYMHCYFKPSGLYEKYIEKFYADLCTDYRN